VFENKSLAAQDLLESQTLITGPAVGLLAQIIKMKYYQKTRQVKNMF